MKRRHRHREATQGKKQQRRLGTHQGNSSRGGTKLPRWAGAAAGLLIAASPFSTLALVAASPPPQRPHSLQSAERVDWWAKIETIEAMLAKQKWKGTEDGREQKSHQIRGVRRRAGPSLIRREERYAGDQGAEHEREQGLDGGTRWCNIGNLIWIARFGGKTAPMGGSLAPTCTYGQ